MLNNYISYFTDCYKADNRAFSILNFFSSKYESQLIIKQKEELVNDELPFQYLPIEIGKSIQQNLELYNHDKELLYCSLFFIGKRKNFQSRITNIIAPLFYYHAEVITHDDLPFVKLNLEKERTLNIAFLKTLSYKTNFNVFYNELEELLIKHPCINNDFILSLKELLEFHIDNLKTQILDFPKLKSASFLKKNATETIEIEQFELHSASGVLISSKANNINGVVNELNILSHENNLSTGLNYFFSKEKEIPNFSKTDFKIPALLNVAQEHIVYNANSYYKSVIFGPSGTGKSYTISAIAQDYISKGKSVLIVTKTSQALNVLEEKLNAFKIGQFAVKIGGDYYKRSIKSYLNKIANGFFHKKYSASKHQIIRKQYHELYDKITAFEKQFNQKIIKEGKRVESIFDKSFFSKITNSIDLIFFRSFEQKEWEIIEEYYQLLQDFEKTADAFLFQSVLSDIVKHANENRLELLKLVNVFESKDKAEANNQLRTINPKLLVKFLPLWLVKIDEISNAIPLKKELYDIAIVDEATQCDIASCLPVFQRAKKVIVAGDTNQLRHISFLSKTQMFNFQKKHKLTTNNNFDYRKNSLLDFILANTPDGKQVVLLDEHYRSLPEIINFSNKQFYHNSLRIMTDIPKNKNKRAVFIKKIKGKQLNSGTNEHEAKQILKKVKQIISKEESFTKKQASTIGVLSPFRQQTDYLTKLIKQELNLNQIKKHKLRLGTPYHFQGEEKDYMFISMTVDNNSHFASLNYLNKTDVFNVAITRAKHEQHVFISVDTKLLNHNSLLRIFLETYSDTDTSCNSLPIQDKFSKEVIAFLTTKKVNIHPGYHIAGLSIDILIEKEGKYLGIDLIGYPGDFKAAFSIERYKILNRVGIEILPISYISWEHQKEVIIQKLENKIFFL